MNRQPHQYNKEDGFDHKTIEIMDSNEQNVIQYFGECLKGDIKIK